MNVDAEMIRLAILLIGTGGTAWLGVKTSLNGVRSDVKEIKKDVRTLVTSDAEQNTAIALNSQRLDYIEKQDDAA